MLGVERRRRRHGDQEAPSGASPASCTPTSTATTQPRRRSSRRPPRPTRCSPIRSAGDLRPVRARRPAQRRLRPHSAGSFEDILSALFGAGRLAVRRPVRRRAGPGRPTAPTSASRCEITLAEVLTGVQPRGLRSRRSRPASTATATAPSPGRRSGPARPAAAPARCSRSAARPSASSSRPAPARPAAATGRSPSSPASAAAARGARSRDRTWDVEVPAGIESGQRIRIAGAGHAGEPGGRPGDLYVLVSVAEDERFERRGEDLVTVLQRARDAGDGGRQALGADARRRARGGDSRRRPARRRDRLKGLGLPALRNAAARGRVRGRRRRDPAQALQASSASSPASSTSRSTASADDAVIRLAVRCRPELAERVLAELLELAPGRRGGGARRRVGGVRDLRRRRASSRRCPISRPRPATGWWRSARPRSPTTGPTAGATSTSRSRSPADGSS